MGMKQIAKLFSLFHDGTISEGIVEKGHLRLKIACLYLAELINAEYEEFEAEIFGVEKLYMLPWMKDSEVQGAPVLIPSEIFSCEYEILQAGLEDGLVHVQCNLDHPRYAGGTLCLNGTSFAVSDQAGEAISLEKLEDLARSYWNSRT